MALYSLVLDKNVRKKDFPKLPLKTRQQVVKIIESLQENPRPSSTQRLTNREEYKLRSGNYRILYVIDDKNLMVQIRAVRHRGSVYK